VSLIEAIDRKVCLLYQPGIGKSLIPAWYKGKGTIYKVREAFKTNQSVLLAVLLAEISESSQGNFRQE
jgi:hypothetical protein